MREPTGPGSPARYRRVAAPRGTRPTTHLALDLSTGTPHPDLLPDLGHLVPITFLAHNVGGDPAGDTISTTLEG